MNGAAAAEIVALLGVGVRATTPVSGGCTGDGWRVDLDDGRRVFAKTRPADRSGAERTGPATPGMYELEARGLRWLADAAAVPVARPLAATDRVLVLEWIEPGGPSSGPGAREAAATLGRQLADLHRSGAPTFGLSYDNYIGDLTQDNTPSDDWPAFYATRRLEPLARRARGQGRLDERLGAALSRVIDRLDTLAGDPEPPSRLHGDLWSGNVVRSAEGAHWLIDPAAHGGHREVDLAMMRLFGGFPQAVFDAYAEAHPLADGHEARVPLWQLAPLLTHVVLFGGGYVEQLRGAVARCA